MAVDLLDIDVRKVAKAKCMASLMFHTRYFFMTQYKRKFVIGQHHEIISEALERVLRGELKRLIINIAPRYGKTELAVKSFISHGLALNPSAKFIHLSYADSLALDNSESIKDLIESAEYQSLFHEVKIKRDSSAKNKWYTTEGGGLLARAAAGQVTGFGAGKVDEEQEIKNLQEEIDEFLNSIEGVHTESNISKKFKFNGAIVIDDPIKPEDADSENNREKVNSRFDSTIRNRANSRDTPIIVIMQRLHPNDLSGYLQREGEQDEWEVISLPCIFFDDDGVKQALWPHKETIEELEKQRISNEVVFERQKQQNPAPKAGLLFPISELKLYNSQKLKESIQDPDAKYLAADPADEGGDDFAGLDTRLIGNKIYVENVLYNTDGTDLNEIAILDMILSQRIMYCGIEGVMGWGDVVKRIKASLDKRNYEGEVRTLRPRTGKHARITTRSSFIKNHFVFRDDWMDFPQYAKFMRNLTTYLKIQEPGKKNKHDDAPDVCEMVASYYEKSFPHLWSTE